jgi:hypothetical protein
VRKKIDKILEERIRVLKYYSAGAKILASHMYWLGRIDEAECIRRKLWKPVSESTASNSDTKSSGQVLKTVRTATSASKRSRPDVKRTKQS